jgi:hypothetical protein
MEWLLVVLALSGYSSSSFSDGRHPSQSSCKDAGEIIVLDLNKLEEQRVLRSMRIHPNGTSTGYAARKWEFICSEVPKKK